MNAVFLPPSVLKRAEDTFRPGRSVAIKVINIGCGAVAVREVRFMRFLGSVPNAEFCPGTRVGHTLSSLIEDTGPALTACPMSVCVVWKVADGGHRSTQRSGALK